MDNPAIAAAAVSPDAASRKDLLLPVLQVLAVLSLALAPLQLTFEVGPVRLTPAEIVVCLAAVVWLVHFLIRPDVADLPPPSHWLVVIVAAFGVFVAGDRLRLGVLTETAQLALYLLVAATIYRAAFRGPQMLRAGTVGLLAGLTIAIALAVSQVAILRVNAQPDPAARVVWGDRAARMANPDEALADDHAVIGYHDADGFHRANPLGAYVTVQTPVQVSSTFGSWNKHGYHASRMGWTAFLALALPLLVALLASRWGGSALRVWLLVAIAGVLISVLAGGLVFVLWGGLLLTAALLSRRARNGVLALFVVWWAFCQMSPAHREELMLDPWRATITTETARWTYGDNAVEHLKKFWGEQQAALNVLRHNPLLGVGAGRYQESISQGYDRLSAVDRQRLESDAQNGYLLFAVSSGFLGLIALVALYWDYVSAARRALAAHPRDPWRAALLAALVTLVAVTLFTNPWVRGTALLIVALFAAVSRADLLLAEEPPKEGD